MKNIKKIILAFSIFIVSECVCQVSISYKLQIYDEEGIFQKNKNLREAFLNTINSEEKPTFKLIVFNKSSKFFKDANLSNKISDGFINGFADFSGDVYSKNDSIYYKIDILGNGIYLKSLKKENWKMENETKLIDNFLCYKATNVNVVEGLNNKIWNHLVIAWYCPKLPFPFGPNGYGNLPGLILELQVRNVSFTMSKIDLTSNEEFNIDILKKSKLLNQQEITSILSKSYDQN